MKKIILAVITGTMLLSSSAFASTKSTDTTLDNSNIVSSSTQNTIIHVNSQDPHGW